MYYSQIFQCDIANGIGCRTTLFVSGCDRHCRGCFNSETWDYKYGKPYTKEVEDWIIQSLHHPHIDGLTILGGEPLNEKNRGTVLKLVRRVREESPDSTIWIYTGYTWEELMYPRMSEDLYQIMVLTDVLVDGPFILSEKDVTLSFRGSRNQRIIDVTETLYQDRIVCLKLDR